jgi:hypothetical protein
MTQFRFRGSEAFTAMLHRPPSQFGVPELPGVVTSIVGPFEILRLRKGVDRMTSP